MNGERPNRPVVVQTGVSASQAKVSKAHVVPQGLCENLINALRLLANQQKDGVSPIQTFATGLCERSSKGILEGLRNCIKVDNHLCSGRGPSERRYKVF